MKKQYLKKKSCVRSCKILAAVSQAVLKGITLMRELCSVSLLVHVVSHPQPKTHPPLMVYKPIQPGSDEFILVNWSYCDVILHSQGYVLSLARTMWCACMWKGKTGFFCSIMEDLLTLRGSYCLTLVDGETVRVTESEQGLECNSRLDLKYSKEPLFSNGDTVTAPFYAIILSEIWAPIK